MDPQPWVCLGDFNEILSLFEKFGGNGRQQGLMEAFQNTLVDCGLSDMGNRGPKFTWSNCQEGAGFIKERLDRVVANQEWCGLQHWRSNISHADPWHVIKRKMDKCKKGLLRWRYEVVGRPNKAFVEQCETLAYIRGEEVDPDLAQANMLQNSLNAQMEQEELRWRQRAKVDWLTYGDKNTKFFNACANQRRKVNKISFINDERGGVWTTQEGIGGAFVDYFENLFTTGGGGNLNGCWTALEGRITDSMNASLMRPFTERKRLRLLFFKCLH